MKVYRTAIQDGKVISKANANVRYFDSIKCYSCRRSTKRAWSITINVLRWYAICPTCAKTADQAIKQLTVKLVKQELNR